MMHCKANLRALVVLVVIFTVLHAFPAMAENAVPQQDAAVIPPCPDYEDASAWAARPAHPDKPVDVFYVYPTIYPDPAPLNMDIRREDLRSRVKGLLKAQAGVYSQSANLYAPFYRQASFTVLDPDKDMFMNQNFRIGADDVARAFEYYLARLNHGRPFILAGHSQGSVVLVDLLRRRFWDAALRKRLVAVYALGYSVTEKDLKKYPWMKFARKADDTGVIISYNSQAPGATGSPVLVSGAKCINPLTWTTSADPADKSLNKGAVFFDDFSGKVIREVPEYVGAQVDAKTGALNVVPPEKLELGHFPKGVYHKFDYAFFYRNLQQNVRERGEAYLSNYR